MTPGPNDRQVERSTRRTVSKFPDPARRFLAPWYKTLYPMPPREVNAHTPSQIAAILGWDEEDTIQAVPYEERPAPAPPNRSERRERRVRNVKRR